MATFSSIIADLDALIVKLKSTLDEAIVLRQELSVMDLPDDIVEIIKGYVGNFPKLIKRFYQCDGAMRFFNGSVCENVVKKRMSEIEAFISIQYPKQGRLGVHFKKTPKQYRLIFGVSFLSETHTQIYKTQDQYCQQLVNMMYSIFDFRRERYERELLRDYKLQYDYKRKYFKQAPKSHF